MLFAMSNRADVLIRPGVVADARVVAKHIRAIAYESESEILDVVQTEAAARRILANPVFGTYFLATVGDECIGQLQVKPVWIPWKNAFAWNVKSAYVHPDHRRRGHFRALYQHARRAAMERGALALNLVVDDSNATAQTTYSQLGLRKCGRKFEMVVDV